MKRRMKRLVIAVILAVALAIVPVSGVLADTSQDVTVTATPSYVSISNSPIDFDFGTVAAGVDEDTGTGHFTITNGSTVTIDITIVCNGWSGGTTPWTYGPAAADTGELKASDGDGTYDVTVDDTTPAALASSVSAGAPVSWELELDAPISFSHGAEQTTTVTLSAAPSA
ncbi:hypothetical protein ES703_43078 [subsurface metagenome]